MSSSFYSKPRPRDSGFEIALYLCSLLNLSKRLFGTPLTCQQSFTAPACSRDCWAPHC